LAVGEAELDGAVLDVAQVLLRVLHRAESILRARGRQPRLPSRVSSLAAQ
jgi:hypothetical protein